MGKELRYRQACMRDSFMRRLFGGSMTDSAAWTSTVSDVRREASKKHHAAGSKSKAGDGPGQTPGSTTRCRLLFLGLNLSTSFLLQLVWGRHLPLSAHWAEMTNEMAWHTPVRVQRRKSQENGRGDDRQWDSVYA